MNASPTVTRLANLIRAQQRVLLVSPPALGKTSRIQAAVALLGWRYFYGIDGRTADLMDRLDAAGAVVPDTAAGVSRLLPLQALRDIIECREPAVWFIDEIGRAPLDVQGGINAVLDTLKRNGSPVVVVAATNRPQDKAGVTSLSEQLRSRFDVTFALSVSAEDERNTDVTYLAPWREEVTNWCNFAADADFDPLVVAWHRSTSGSTLYNWKPNQNAAVRYADFRSWHTVSNLLKAGLTDVDTIAAAIGRGVAAQFTAFAALAREIPLPSQVLADPHGARVPAEPAACWFISAYLPPAVTSKNVGAFLTYIDRLPRAYTALAANDLHRRHVNKPAGSPIRSTEWNAWFAKNHDLFAI